MTIVMTMTTVAAMKSQRSAARSVLTKTMSQGHPTTTTRTKLSRLYICLFAFAHINLLSLFILSISSQTVSKYVFDRDLLHYHPQVGLVNCVP